MQRIFISGPIFNTPSGPSGQGGKLFTQLQGEGFTVYRKSAVRNKLARVADILAFALFRIRSYDVVLVQMFSNMAFWVDFVLIRLMALFGKKTIAVIRGGAFPDFFDKYPGLVGSTLKKCDVITSPSYFIRDHLAKKGFEVQYVPNFIDTSLFPYCWKFTGQPKLLWVRAFTHIYRPELAVGIVHLLKKQFPSIHLTMVGPDQGLRESTTTLIHKLNLENHITLTGPVPNNELSNYYSSHSVYLNTTLYESFGVALAEAACSGIPVITSSVGEIPFIWAHNKDMYLVEGGDPEDYVAGITRLIEDQPFAESLSLSAAKKASQYNWKSIRETWINFLQPS